MSGIIGRIGSKSGVIGLLDDAQRNAWHVYRSAIVDYSTDAYIAFDGTVFIGSNITLSAGQITVTEPGIYLCSFGFCDFNKTRMHSWEVHLEGARIGSGARILMNPVSAGAADNVGGSSMTHPIRCDAGDELGINGTGHINGNAGASTTWFTGAKIGEKS